MISFIRNKKFTTPMHVLYILVLFIMLYELKIKARDEIRAVKQTIGTFYMQHIIIV